MKAALMILAVTASLSFLMTAIHGHSSFLQTVKDRYLVGHVTDRLKASSVLSCAQHCLKRRPRCRSINYGEADGKKSCELNGKGSESTDAESSSFVSLPGFIFAQLLNLEVCSDESYQQLLLFFLIALEYSAQGTFSLGSDHLGCRNTHFIVKE